MEETMMKKIIYILMMAVFALTSCQDDEVVRTPEAEDGDLVTLSVSLRIPDMQQATSRAFGEGGLDYLVTCPLQMVVFDHNHLLREELNVLADDAASDAVGIYDIAKGTDEITFKVRLTKAVNKRYIHFIVNSPKSGYAFGDESTLIAPLSVSLNGNGTENDVYWQRMEFDDIDGDTDMSRIPMIRNFAKITVENKATDFDYTGFYVVNVWNKGTVAPYKGEGAFAVLNSDETMRSYDEITKTEGYEGIWPSDATLTQNDLTSDPITQTDAFYMYERRNTYVSEDIPATYLLVEGIYNNSEYWYKLDLVYDVDKNGDRVTKAEQKAVGKQYYNILRNFHYAVSIDEVKGAGYATAKEAASHAASNNLSGSIDIRDLTNISNAINRLFVSYTDTTIVDNSAVTVRYKYVTTDGTVDNNKVTVLKLPTKDTSDDRMTSFIPETGDDDDDWRTVTVTFENIPTNWEVITNTLRFVSEDGLSREVDFNLRRKMYMIVECDPTVVAFGSEEQVAANILIPTNVTGENDPYQFFPIDFLVEAEDMTLSPDVATNKTSITSSPYEMPVVLGTSIIPDKATANKQTFRYKRTVTNAEYQSLEEKTVTVQYNGQTVTGTYKVIPCHFLTNTYTSATSVYAQNEYFTLIKEGEFVNRTLTLSGAENYGTDQTVTLTLGEDVTSELGENYSITITEGSNTTGFNGTSYTTKTFGEDIVVTIYNADGSVYTTLTQQRNTLSAKITSIKYGSSTLSSGAVTASFEDSSSSFTYSGSNTYSLVLSGLTESSRITFTYSHTTTTGSGPNKQTVTTVYTGTATVENCSSGASITLSST